MKELYIQPRIEVVEVETEKMLALSLSDKLASSSEDVLTNRRRAPEAICGSEASKRRSQ